MPKDIKYPHLPEKFGAFPTAELPEDVKQYISTAIIRSGQKTSLSTIRLIIIEGCRKNVLNQPSA